MLYLFYQDRMRENLCSGFCLVTVKSSGLIFHPDTLISTGFLSAPKQVTAGNWPNPQRLATLKQHPVSVFSVLYFMLHLETLNLLLAHRQHLSGPFYKRQKSPQKTVKCHKCRVFFFFCSD